MPSALRPRLAALALVLSLAACGGGSGSNTVTFVTPPGGSPGAVTISPSTLAFAGAGSAPQTFTITSTVAGSTGPLLNSAGCSPAATLSGGSTTLPATYTVTPQAIGSCAIVVTVGSKSATVGITVGTPPNAPGTISGSQSGLTLVLGGGTQSYTVNVSGGTGPGTIAFDAAACNGIATVTGGGGVPPQTFTAAPVGVGSCNVTVTDGSQSFAVPITVNPAAASGLSVSPSTMNFAGRNAAAQSFTLNFVGNPGAVSVDQSSCTTPKIAFFQISGAAPGTPVSLPATGTVTPYGSQVGGTGTCTIVFTPQTGSSASILVTVSPP